MLRSELSDTESEDGDETRNDAAADEPPTRRKTPIKSEPTDGTSPVNPAGRLGGTSMDL